MSRGYGLADTYRITYFLISDVPLPTAARPPLPILLFAATLRLFGEKLFPIVILQAAIDSGIAILTYLIAYRLFRSASTTYPQIDSRMAHFGGLLAAVGFACFLPEWSNLVGFQSEPLFTLLLTGALALVMFTRGRLSLAATGLLFGLAALTRPSVLPLPILLVPWLVWQRGVAFKRAMLVPLLMGLVLVPWGIRNYLVFHHVVLTETLAGYNFYRHSGVIEQDNYIHYVRYDEANPKILSLLQSRGLTPSTVSEPELDALLMQEARRIIISHPRRYIDLCLHRATWLFYYEDEYPMKDHLYIYEVMKATLLGLFGLALWRYRVDWMSQLGPFWLMLGYTVFLHALIVAQFRYLLPLIPFMMSVCAYAIVRGSIELHTLYQRALPA